MSCAWREIQRSNFTDWEALGEFIRLNIVRTNPKTPLNIPKRLAEKIEKGKIEDPILRQFLPTLEENQASPLFVLDPVGDIESRKTQKLLHKYEGRALLLCTSACAMHCRYCFRQHFEYAKEASFSDELEMIREDASLREMILSGGDPLSLSNGALKDLCHSLSEIAHVKRLRFHTRFPMGIPERIDDEFLEMLQLLPLQVFFVIHSNHPREWDEEIFSALKKIQRLGIPVLCSSVLLKGINDDADTLHQLFEMLVDNGILPYYLNQLDRAQGTAHFEVSEKQGLEMMQEVSSRLSGYAVPRYVRETAGEKSKTQVT